MGGRRVEDYVGGLYRLGLEMGYMTYCLCSIGQEAGKCSLLGSQGGNGNGFGEQLASSYPSHLEEENVRNSGASFSSKRAVSFYRDSSV